LEWTLEPSFRIVPAPEPTPPVQAIFTNCTELRAVYPDGVDRNHPAY